MNRPYDDNVELSRDLGLFSVTMIGVGAMIGAGIFVLTGIAAETAGPSLVIVFLMNGFVTLLTAMTYAELGSAIPEAGGGYLWVKKSLSKLQGFLSGWMSWFAHAVAGSLYALGFGAYFQLLLSNLGINMGLEAELMKKFLAVIVVLIFIYFNYKGASKMGMVENIVTVSKVLIIILFILFGLNVMFHSPQWTDNFEDFMPNGMSGVVMAMGLTFIAFEGYEIIVQCGEELKNPRKNIPRAVFLSLLIVIPIYILVAIVSIGAISVPPGEGISSTWEYLGKYKELGLLKAAGQFMPYGVPLLLIGGLLSTMSALNATTFSSTRVSFAMGRGFDLPSIFKRIHPKNKTPYSALFISGFLIILMAVTLPIEDVASAANILFLLLFIQVNIAALKIRREMGDKLDYGFKTPLFPYTQYVAIISLTFLVLYMYLLSPIAWVVTLIWIGIGYLFYITYTIEKEELETGKILREIQPGKYHVLVSLKDEEMLTPLMTIASGIAKSKESDIVILNAIEIPYQTFLHAGKRFLRDSEILLDKAEKGAKEYGVPLRKKISISHDPSEAIINFATKGRSDIIIMGWSGEVYKEKVRRSTPRKVMKNTPCNVCIVKPHNFDKISRILIPLGSDMAANFFRLRIAKRLSDTFNSNIEAIIILKPEESEKNKKIEKIQEDIKKIHKDLKIRIVRDSSLEKCLVRESKKYDLIIIGSSREWIIEGILFGSVQDRIVNRSHCTVILAKQPEHKVESRFSLLVNKLWDWNN